MGLTSRCTVTIDLILILRKYAIGCHVSGCYTGILSYAYALILLTPSCEGLNIMLHMCGKYAIDHDIVFNSVMIKCMLFSNDTIWFSFYSLYCIDAYGCQIWNFSYDSNEMYYMYVAWCKVL